MCTKCEQIYAKHEQTCECNSVNDQHAKNKSEFTDQGSFLKISTDNPASASVLHADEMERCRTSRVRLVSTHGLHSRKKREREPSRIPYRKVIKLFRKTRIIRDAVKSYLKKCIPSSSKLKLVLSKCNRYQFTERFGRSKCALSLKKVLCDAKLVPICCAAENIKA